MTREKEVTIYDLARKLNISSSTVSRALKNDPVVNNKTRKKIADLAAAEGYRSNHFARNLRNQTTQTIGVILPKIDSYFMSSVIAGMENAASTKGYNLIISQSSESFEKEKLNAATMFKNRVDGLLVSLAYDTSDMFHLESFFNKNIPLVFFDRVEHHTNCSNILIDNWQAGYDVTNHLIKQGCKKIIHLTAIPQRNVYADRLRGYQEALADQGIEFKDEYLIIDNLSQEAGYRAAALILQMEPLPDGVFAANDNCGVSCMIALKKSGIRIPEDIAFAGFNNDPVSQVIEPNLTTIHNPGYEMGQEATFNLINQLNRSAPITPVKTIVLNSPLIIRGSSMRLKKEPST